MNGPVVNWTRAGLRAIACMAAAALLATAGMVRAQDAPDLGWLSPAERAWLAEHKVIRVGVDPGYAPYAYIDEQGRYQGVSADIMALLATMLDLRLELVPLPRWADVLQAARERRIDLITTASRRPERESYLAFTREYIHTPLVVMTRVDWADLRTPDELANLRVALVREYGATRRVLARYPGVPQVPVDQPSDGLIAVAQGQADAYVGVLGVNLHLARRMGLTNLKVNVGFDLRSNAQTIAVRKDWAPLATILDKALARLPPAERIAIDARWLPELAPGGAGPQRDLPPQAKAWIDAGHELRVGYETDRLPFSGRGTDGEPVGLLPDVLREIQHRSGLRLRWQPGAAADLAAALRRGQLDAVLDERDLNAAASDLRHTMPLYESSFVFLCRREAACEGRREALVGKTVAVRAGSWAHDRIQRWPQVRLRLLDTDQALMQALEAGEVDAVLGEARSIQRALDMRRTPVPTRLQPALGLGTVRPRMVLRPEMLEAVMAIDWARESIGAEDMSGLRSRWVGVPPQQAGFERAAVLRTAGVALSLALLMFGFLLWANRRQRREIVLRRQAEAALAEARDAALSASRHKSEFVAHTSHELRTPLNAIVGATRLLQLSTGDSRQRDLLDILDGASRSLLRLVDDLLDLARIESGQLELREAPFELTTCLGEALDQVEHAARRKGLALRRTLDSTLPVQVNGDGDRLRQVLVNLLGNAVKYTERGEVTLQARVLAQDERGSLIEFAVSDTGPGIAPEWRRRVFEPFQRGAATNSPAPRHTDGVGLGLGIARQIVALMGADLELNSELGEGSRFHFQIRLKADSGATASAPVGAEPATVPEPAGGAAAGAEFAAALAPGCALVVEDNDVNMLLARSVLERGGWSVREAATGAQALEIAERDAGAIDVVLMDVGLPDFDGLELTRRLKTGTARVAALPVIGLTARAMPEERQACLDAGMLDVVLKPFDIPRLWQAIAAARQPFPS